MAPITRAIALALAASGVIGQAQAQQAFSSAWYANKGVVQSTAQATGYLPNGTAASTLTSTAGQKQRANEQLQRSISNLNLAAQAIAAQQAAQAAARLAAASDGSSVPDGLTDGGLEIDTNSLTKGWLNAKAPVQTTANGKTTVAIEQTADKAILNWETFNVGRNTTVDFQQQKDWAVLNRVNDPLARPSQILGQIKGDGTVLIVNRNGIIFNGTSQVNTHNLVAAAANITDNQFSSKGLYFDTDGSQATFTNALGKIEIQAGAQITTDTPKSSIEGGGYVLLLGREVANAGEITTPNGQTVLAAGDSFYIRKGVGTDSNSGSTTRGNEVSADLTNAGSNAGKVLNTGLITATIGDITLTGHEVVQDGVAVATTSTSVRGTIHLSNRTSDASGTITLAEGATTAIVLDTSGSTALDSQRDAALEKLGTTTGNKVTTNFNNLSSLTDRTDLSRIEIVSGNTVEFQNESLTLATGGEIAVSATKRTLVNAGAQLDVSGAVGVSVSMESNNIKVNVQGNEQRDSSTNRDSKNLNNSDVWIDSRTLVYVPAGTNGYATDRWYTAGGLLEVSGYLANDGHSVGEWMAQGGTVTVSGGDLITRAGSRINLSGGTLDVATGYIKQSWLKGSDGQLYEVSSAPGDLQYTGLYQGFEQSHARWGVTDHYYNPLIAPQRRLENGYTVGRDAGKLVVATNNAVLEGEIISDVYQGDQQTQAAQAGLDGYYQSQYAVARAGQLIIGSYKPIYDADAKLLRYVLTPLLDSVTLTEVEGSTADGVQLNDAVAADRQGTLVLDSSDLNAQGLGAIRIAAKETIAVDSALEVVSGGEIVLYAAAVDVAANLTAHSGTIRLGNVLAQPYVTVSTDGTTYGVGDTGITVPTALEGGVKVHAGVSLDASGLQTDLRSAEVGNNSALAYVDGGTVSIRSTESVTLESGSLIDVSSGATVLADGSVTGGTGGNVQLGSGLGNGASSATAVLTLDGTIRGYGVKGGGTLDIESASAISIGGKLVAKDGVLQAGESSLADLILLEDVEIMVLKGGVLPVAYSYVVTKVLPGEVVGSTGVKSGTDIVITADWLPPLKEGSGYVFQINGQNAYRTDKGIEITVNGIQEIWSSIPAGSKVQFRAANISPGTLTSFVDYVVPANVFSGNYLPINARTVQLQSGDLAPYDVTLTLKTGSRLAAGTTLATDVAVGATTTLSTDLFQTGFAQYNIRAHNGLVVADGVSLEVTMPVLQANVASLLSSSGSGGSGLEDFLQVWLPDLYQETYKTRTVSQRGGASLSLAAGAGVEGLGDGDLVIGTGASLRVDPGQSIELSSRGSLTVDGLLQAKGGDISLLGPMTVGAGALADGGSVADGSANQRAITLGEHAVLDVSAASYVTEDEQGQPHGLLTDGGSITIGGTMQESGSRAIASDAFVVIKQGALVNASGGQAQLNLNGSGTRTITSNGGSISIASDSGLYLDGTLRAEAGGAGASGGTLVVALEAPNYLSSTVDNAVLAVRELTVVQQHASGASDAGGLTYGHATLGVDQVEDGGFSSLTLYSNGALSFGGDVNLALGKELRLYSGALAVAKGVDPSIKVSLSAPYVLLAGITDNGASKDGYVRPSYQGGVSTLDSQATLTATADLLDIKGTVTSGLNGTVNSVQVERAGFDQLNLISEGDLRFVAGTHMLNNSTSDAELDSTGDILLRAAQVYPATGVKARVLAGRADERTYDPEGRLVIERYDATAADPALPYSVFGSLLLGAATIEQNGVLRAPLGSITLGTDESLTVGSTNTVTLGTGSLTSVSADGLVMPYGGTADDVTWYYLGKKVGLTGIGDSAGITLSATDVTVKEGALLDLSGGGELQGAGFVSGRGGSTDARYHPLVQVSNKGFTLPSLKTNPVYAIVPGYASSYAPADSTGAVDPLVGQQITIKAGDIPGLAAGTYTLLPSSYALLPGAYRVEINGAASGWTSTSATAMRNGSYSTSGTISTANTGISNSLSSQLIITSADVLRTYSQYNETSYAEFVQAQAKLNGTVRAGLPADAKSLTIRMPSSSKSTLTFDGLADFTPAKNGYGGTASILTSTGTVGDGAIEILADTALPTVAFDGLSLYASDLNAIGAARLTVGGSLGSTYGTQTNGTNLSNYVDVTGQTGSIVLREGAILKAPEVFLVAANTSGGITIETGAGINTIGMGEVAYDSTDGYIYRPGANAVVAASNGWLNMLAPEASMYAPIGSGPIAIGVCGATCTGTTELYSQGTLLAATLSDFEMSDSVRYGTRNLVLAVGTVNAGSEADLAAAAASGALTSGLTLNQSVLNRLLQGDTAYGAPALERLVLTAAESVNFFGNVSLDTTNAATGKSTLDNLVLSTPAIYGYGSAGDVATITTGKLTWAGLAGEAPTPVSGGRGTGSGTLKVNAGVIEFGYDSTAQPNGVDDFARTILGFANVQLNATDRITANQKGSLSVYQSQVADSNGLHYEGGNLTLTAPLITGAGGSVNRITAGGTLQVLAPASGAADAAATSLAADVETGAELNLTGNTVRIDTTVALPSGKLTVTAEGDIVLGDSAWLDLSGREIVMYDTSSYSWGGDVTLRSNSGNITQAAGSTIDLSAQYNNAGLLTATALAAGAGIVDLQGTLLGSASGHYDAGGTLVPYRAGGVDISAQHLGRSGTLTEQFASLNTELNAGGFLGERSFQLKQGDLSIGNELKGSEINISLDTGQLSVLGTIDASGEQVGSIRLAAAHGLTLASSAVLDAHSTVLRVDSYGEIIDSPNRAVVELDAGTGTLVLADGVRIDLRHGINSTNGDGKNRGTLELYAARLGSHGSANDADAATFGDIAIDARGSVVIQGAKSIAVYGKQVYSDAAYGSDAAASGRPYQVIDQAYLDTKHAEATQFINAALGNASLLDSKLAGLNNATYREVFHLRPAVEIVSATANGDLVVQGDLDLSGYRYASLNPNTQQTGVYGSGEVGQLTLRAGGDLSIYGSINDGFAPPPETPDDDGWLLTTGVQAFGGDVVVPIAGITLAEGTVYPAGKTLNYAITAKNVTLPVGTVLPSTITLSSALTLPAGTVLAADVRAADGSVLLAAGTVVGTGGLALPSGAQLLAGTRLPMAVTLASLTWPKGVALPVAMTQLGSLALPVGALIASGTDVVLPGDALSVNLRPADSTGHQAQNWAVADMLPEGSQSWSLRLVAGADTQAADNRLTRLNAGSIVLADSHYTVQSTGGGVLLGLSEQGVDAVVQAMWGLPSGITDKSQLVGKTQAELLVLYEVGSWDDFGLGANFWSPTTGNIQMGLTTQGVNAVVDAMYGLPSSITDKSQLVGKTQAELLALYDTGSWSDFGLAANFWDYSVGNGTTITLPIEFNVKSPIFSVVRTGTGDLDIAAGGNFSMQSPYGVYTAGTQKSLGNTTLDASYNQVRGKINGTTVLGTVAGDTAAAYESLVSGTNSLYQAWYPDGGGNLWVNVKGDLTGDSWSSSGELATASSSVGNWLWRQGTGDTAGVNDVPTAWWINFGTYTYTERKDNNGTSMYWPTVTGFTGLGTLGGGDATIRVGGEAGVITTRSTDSVSSTSSKSARSQGVVLAIGSTGRVLADGSLVLTGGGDLDVRIGGGWNSSVDARLTQVNNLTAQTHELYGALVNLRGAINLVAGQIGTVELFYGTVQDANEVRASDPYTSSQSRATGGLMLMEGDSSATISSRGDLVLGGTGDAGLVETPNGTAFTSSVGNGQNGQSWFSLWTDKTALNLLSAGGNLAFDTRASETIADPKVTNWDYTSNGGWFLLPGNVSAVAAMGSIYYGQSAAYGNTFGNATQWDTAGLLLAPLGERRIELLAGDSIYGSGYAISSSGADTSTMATIYQPAFSGSSASSSYTNVSLNSRSAYFLPLLAFGINSVGSEAGVSDSATEPSRFYAVDGDIVGLQTGTVVEYSPGSSARAKEVDYVAAGPVAVRAGRDIVYTGTRSDEVLPLLSYLAGDRSAAWVSGNLIVHTHANDVSVVEAGRDILYANFEIAGPGTLEISAGRNIVQNDKSSVTSIGPVVSGDSRSGASIVVQAGATASATDYLGFVKPYLDAANQADSSQALAEQPGKVVKTYVSELVDWLQARYGFAGTAEEALAYFNALAPEQQRIFARQVYFAELRESGREYNDAEGARFGSYLRGRNAIAALFPDQDTNGNKVTYQGDLLIYGGSGIHTNLGGDIQVLTPGGAQTYGVEGAAPPATAGLITRGQGDIQLYSLDSIRLGQSRIMTTFGGDILAWSAEGDINAGRGSKTTIIYTPPRRVYDNWGNVTVSPDVPSTGAGIATLNPIPEVKPGDVDLIAPLGTIDAGEAGIRVSGNVNIAALHVVNADNIKVQGEATGIPSVASVNVGALTNASAAASQATVAAQEVVQRERASARSSLPSIVTVRVIGFGNEPMEVGEPASAPPPLPQGGQQSSTRVPYDPQNFVQIAAHGGVFDSAVMSKLSEAEQRELRQAK